MHFSLWLFNFLDFTCFISQWILRWVHESSFTVIPDFSYLFSYLFFSHADFPLQFSLRFNINNTKISEMHSFKLVSHHSWLFNSELTICGLSLQVLLSRTLWAQYLWPFMSSGLLCGLESEPLCILLFSDGPWGEQNCLCFHKCAYILLSSAPGVCEWIFRMWVQRPKSGFNVIEMLLAKYIWVRFLSGVWGVFLCVSVLLLFFSFSEVLSSRGGPLGGGQSLEVVESHVLEEM